MPKLQLEQKHKLHLKVICLYQNNIILYSRIILPYEFKTLILFDYICVNLWPETMMVSALYNSAFFTWFSEFITNQEKVLHTWNILNSNNSFIEKGKIK